MPDIAVAGIIVGPIALLFLALILNAKRVDRRKAKERLEAIKAIEARGGSVYDDGRTLIITDGRRSVTITGA